MIDFTEAELRKFSPRMADFYRRSLLDGKAHLADAGILANGMRFAHFMAQFGGETAGGTIVRESLNYTSVKRIREVWPARAKKSTEAKLRSLVRNPVALGDWAYGGRMGNRKGTSDGYDYRGGGFLQTTGKAAVADFCGKLGIDLSPDLLDDPDATLRFACFEWKSSGCNELADANDLLGISKAINTGSANSGIMPNGMEHRTAWFNRAKPIWWDAEMKATETAPPPTPMQNVAASAPASRTVLGVQLSIIGAILAAAQDFIAEAVKQIGLLAPAREVLSGLGVTPAKVAFALTLAGCLYALYARLDASAKGKIG
jgi:putative chitinase